MEKIMVSGEKTKKLWENPEYRKYMSNAHKGQRAWNKGIPLSEQLDENTNYERKKKISKTLKTKYKNGERASWSVGKTKYTDKRLRLQAIEVSKTMEGHLVLPKTKIKIKESNLKYWKNISKTKKENFKKNIKESMKKIVHHINGNHSDNSPENLIVMTQSEHAKLHCNKRWNNKK